jgi:transposase
VSYNSTKETLFHQSLVRGRMERVISALMYRAFRHDESKHEEPEKSAIDRVRPELKKLDYGSPEYRALKNEFAQYHYKDPRNRHHLQHFENGIEGMNLVDVLEMVCDIRASGDTSKDSDVRANIRKMDIPPIVQTLIINTLDDLGW